MERLRKKREVADCAGAIEGPYQQAGQQHQDQRRPDRQHQLQPLARHEARPHEGDRQQPSCYRHHPGQGPHEPLQALGLARHHRQEGAQRQAVQPERGQDVGGQPAQPHERPYQPGQHSAQRGRELTAMSARGRRARRKTTSGQNK